MQTDQPAPEFELDDCLGSRFSLAAQRGRRGVAITFVRGAW